MILGLFLVFISAGFGQNKVQGELLLRFRDYQNKQFNAVTPLLEFEWEREITEGDSKSVVNLGGRYFKIDDHEFEPTASLGQQVENWSVKLGFQTISWGQSFAVFSADLVNPKDLRDPLNTDPAWYNLPLFLLNTEYFFDKGGIQLYVAPLPRNNKYSLPNKESDFLKSQGSLLQFTRPDEFSKDILSENFEFGGKINYLFGNGLELSFFGLRHWNRNAVFLTQLESGVPKLKPLRFQVDSYGLGFSYDLNEWLEGLVARGDYVAHLHDQRANSTGTAILTGEAYDTVTGLDWTSDFGWTLGAQAITHVNQGARESLGTLRILRKLFADKLELSGLVFTGFNTKEHWYQPKITWIPVSALELSLLADFIDADLNDPWSSLAPLDKEDRTQVQFRYLF